MLLGTAGGQTEKPELVPQADPLQEPVPMAPRKADDPDQKPSSATENLPHLSPSEVPTHPPIKPLAPAPQPEESPTRNAHPTEAHKGLSPEFLLSRKEKARALTQERIERLLSQAQVNQKINQPKLAETQYLQILTLQGTPEQRQDTYLSLIQFYQNPAYQDLRRLMILYEKFAREFPTHPLVPEIFLTLGRYYREKGGHHRALQLFYRVMNAALRISRDQIALYQQATLQAQLEIARTYFDLSNYTKAAEFFERIDPAPLEDFDKQSLLFEGAYARYLAGEPERALWKLEAFVKRFPSSFFTAQAYFLLSLLYEKNQRQGDAREAVITLLTASPQALGEDSETAERDRVWKFWRQKAGNRLANQLYQQADYPQAIRLYTAMRDAEAEASWQIPIVYQLAQCYQKINLPAKAQSLYEQIVQTKPEILQKSEFLTHLAQMAKEQLEHLKWKESTQARLKSLVQPTGPAPTPTVDSPLAATETGLSAPISPNGEEKTNAPAPTAP